MTDEFSYFFDFLVQENHRSEPEVAESSKNEKKRTSFYPDVDFQMSLGKKWGLMTEIGGGRNFENKIRGDESSK